LVFYIEGKAFAKGITNQIAKQTTWTQMSGTPNECLVQGAVFEKINLVSVTFMKSGNCRQIQTGSKFVP
jgi:hypothetical protein